MAEQKLLESAAGAKKSSVDRVNKGRVKVADNSVKLRGSGRQAEKSLQTQNAILEATLQCLVDLGYINTTMEKIAECAKVSRGAMMHHYESRADVIENAARYLADKRLTEFEHLARTLVPPLTDNNILPEHMNKTMRFLSRFYSLPSFVAMHELLLAARTDKSLAKIMRQVQKRFSTRQTQLVLEIFPQWEGKREMMMQLNDMVHFAYQGMAMTHMNFLDAKRIAGVHDILARIAFKGYLREL
jgi:AcrR family transcriptional regulator